MRIAFAATSQDDEVNQHFGSARYWQIFDVYNDNSEFIETRKTNSSCKGHCEGGFDNILDRLFDCEAIFVSKIGEGAANYCISKGKRVFECSGEIQDIILELRGSGDFL